MPELPEIEHLRRTLEPWLVGARVVGVDLRRRDVVRIAGSRKARRGVRPEMLLAGDRIVALRRRGKSLAIVGSSGRVLVAHMGMSGAMMVEAAPECWASQKGKEVARNFRLRSHPRRGLLPQGRGKPVRDKHVHCVWELERAQSTVQTPVPPCSHSHFRLLFRDPRRFGGLWPFDSMDDLLTHAGGWARLGPDALEPPLDAEMLRERLLRTLQPMKAALLNQALIAGVGNIYADESLFAAGIHPLLPPRRVSAEQWGLLADAIRTILRAAADSGGSTIRTYRDASGRAGTFAFEHCVYGRGGEACVHCGATLHMRIIAQRTSVFCGRCQPRRNSRRSAISRTSDRELCTSNSGQ
jgi:formamidopyrimidine-DNA glycosylase